MALVVATLATLIVSGLFWQQFVLLRTIENQQLIVQSRVLMAGTLDWARAMLREDLSRSSHDGLDDGPKGLAETRLDQLGESSTLAAQASIAGSIEDAQSRLNLRNLVGDDGQIIDRELEVLKSLCGMLGAPTVSAELIALRMKEAFVPPPADGDAGTKADTIRPLPPILSTDIAAIPGLEGDVAAKLAPYLVVLDINKTRLNVNTAFDVTCEKWYGSARPPSGSDRALGYDFWFRQQLNLDAAHVDEIEGVLDQMLRSENRFAIHLERIGEQNLRLKLGKLVRQVPNPAYWAFHGGCTYPLPSLLAITHGDLDASNILVDEQHETWLIDFFHTGIGPILRDIQELESVVKFELLASNRLQERYLLEQDLVAKVSLDDSILVDGQPIKVIAERDPAKIGWRDYGAEIVIESTGLPRFDVIGLDIGWIF